MAEDKQKKEHYQKKLDWERWKKDLSPEADAKAHLETNKAFLKYLATDENLLKQIEDAENATDIKKILDQIDH